MVWGGDQDLFFVSVCISCCFYIIGGKEFASVLLLTVNLLCKSTSICILLTYLSLIRWIPDYLITGTFSKVLNSGCKISIVFFPRLLLIFYNLCISVCILNQLISIKSVYRDINWEEWHLNSTVSTKSWRRYIHLFVFLNFFAIWEVCMTLFLNILWIFTVL